ncbi:MAG TPA: dodecin family protein [Candidatus Binatia bacterium]|jgi:flavin-binding protein dodecin|nr:dodecin family protein [Candidatus Binatia bacterium]
MVVKVIEILGVSEESFDDAMKQGIARASKTVKNITGVDVLGKTGDVKDGKITQYRVNMKLCFVVED